MGDPARDLECGIRPFHGATMADTPSRREATLIDLHPLHETLQQLREHRDRALAAELLEQHLVDFRYTSPWVFLKRLAQLRQLHHDISVIGTCADGRESRGEPGSG